MSPASIIFGNSYKGQIAKERVLGAEGKRPNKKGKKKKKEKKEKRKKTRSHHERQSQSQVGSTLSEK